MRASKGVVWLSSFLMVLAAFVFMYPFIWMFAGSFKSNLQIFDTQSFWPNRWNGEWFEALFSGKYFDFWRSLRNSFFISALQALAATFLASMAGYALGIGRFRGRAFLIGVAVALIVLPVQASALPMLEWINRIGLFDTLWGAVVPGLASGLGLLFFTRVFALLPRDLLDAARSEGAGDWRIFIICLPLVRSFMLAYGFLHFVLAWHAHVIPLLVLHSDAQRTLPLSLAALSGNSMNTPQAVILAASSFGMLVMLGVFGLLYSRLKTALSEFAVG
ncbi:MAG: carbohydrate ABC transporter permease [Verrucomicrobiota bacterium]